LLWAEWVRDEVVAEVAHRHVLLCPLFRRRRELLKELARAGAEAVQELVRLAYGSDARPGVVVSVATAGDLLQWHPHLHLITTDAGRTKDGSWHPLPEWDGLRLMTLFRERLLAKLVEKRAISKELVAKLVAWRQSGIPSRSRSSFTWTAKRRCSTARSCPDPGQHRTLFYGEIAYSSGQIAYCFLSPASTKRPGGATDPTG